MNSKSDVHIPSNIFMISDSQIWKIRQAFAQGVSDHQKCAFDIWKMSICSWQTSKLTISKLKIQNWNFQIGKFQIENVQIEKFQIENP